jgi:uncharacterized protein YprB with RNaseH-like and TPR domain
MKKGTTNGQHNPVTVTIPCSNSRSIPTFDDFFNEAKRRCEAEKDAKNEAYSFILSTGRLQEFSEFCISTRGLNHHENCVNLLGLASSGASQTN